MPTTYTAPGVYIEEIPSGVRTITGVATSITAFVGTAPRGPVNEPTPIASFGDYTRTFGDPSVDPPAATPLLYAVRQFFDNGGGQGIVVRVAKNGKAASLALGTGQQAPNDELSIEAASPGDWGNNLQATVDHDTADPNDDRLFNLTVREMVNGQTVAIERHFNLSIDPADARYAPRILEQSSQLVRVPKVDGQWTVPNARPDATAQAVTVADGDKGTGGDTVTNQDVTGDEGARTGMHALATVDLFNLLVIPPLPGNPVTAGEVYQPALALCRDHRAMLLVDLPDVAYTAIANEVSNLNLAFPDVRNAAAYYPLLTMTDPVKGGISTFPPSAAVAGVMARTDAQRGVWKAPAGTDASVAGALDTSRKITETESGALNQQGVNCLRSFPVYGRVVWGARTLAGADQRADDYKYVPIRRLALFIEESLYRGTQWVVFEPNDEPLWSQIRLNVGAFMNRLFRQGAFQGKTPAEAYFVKVDKETTPQADINLGIVNIVVGFAPLKPVEFVIIKVQQIAGQIQT
jgi:uncharacterized protein